MDPTAAWNQMVDAVVTADWEAATRLAENLLDWLGKEGFPPAISGQPVFDRIAARETCEAIAAWDV